MKHKNMIRVLIGFIAVLIGLFLVVTDRIKPFINWLARVAKKFSKFSIRKWRYKMRIKHRVRRIAKNVRRKMRERI